MHWGEVLSHQITTKWHSTAIDQLIYAKRKRIQEIWRNQEPDYLATSIQVCWHNKKQKKKKNTPENWRNYNAHVSTRHHYLKIFFLQFLCAWWCMCFWAMMHLLTRHTAQVYEVRLHSSHNIPFVRNDRIDRTPVFQL